MLAMERGVDQQFYHLPTQRLAYDRQRVDWPSIVSSLLFARWLRLLLPDVFSSLLQKQGTNRLKRA